MSTECSTSHSKGQTHVPRRMLSVHDEPDDCVRERSVVLGAEGPAQLRSARLRGPQLCGSELCRSKLRGPFVDL